MNTNNKMISISESQFSKLRTLIKGLNLFLTSIDGEKPKTPLYWSGSKSDLIELAYGILETKHFNNGDIEIKEAVNYLSEVFSFPVIDYYDTFRAIRRRVDSRTLFLDEMKEKLNDRMDEMDNGVFKKKRK